MHAKVHSAAVCGVDAVPVEIEIDIGRGLPGVVVLGLPDAGVKEGRDRIRPALRNSGFDFPIHRVTANLAPAHLRKAGPVYDLPLALGVLAASEQLPPAAIARLARHAVIGELALDGRVRPIRGALPMAIAAHRAGRTGVIVPRENAGEAAVIEGLAAIGVESVREAAAYLTGELAIEPARPSAPGPPIETEEPLDFADVRGQGQAKEALLVAAAGGHNVLMTGPPGVGKTMVARRLPSILPPLGPDEALEVTRIASVAGLLGARGGLVREPPFRAPHHTASEAALVGGGSPLQPGEVTLAHRGVLFLDELPEFGPRKLDTLRQPLEEGRVRLARAGVAIEFPAEFMCVAAMNPCPCGLADVRRPCRCTPPMVHRYQSRVSGPLRDRFDLQIEFSQVEPAPGRGERSGPSSQEMRERVLEARGRQSARYATLVGGRAKLNARLAGAALRRATALDDAAEAVLRTAAERYRLSARSIVKVLRVARTVADLAGSDRVESEHIVTAVGMRTSEIALEAPDAPPRDGKRRPASAAQAG